MTKDKGNRINKEKKKRKKFGPDVKYDGKANDYWPDE